MGLKYDAWEAYDDYEDTASADEDWHMHTGTPTNTPVPLHTLIKPNRKKEKKTRK